MAELVYEGRRWRTAVRGSRFDPNVAGGDTQIFQLVALGRGRLWRHRGVGRAGAIPWLGLSEVNLRGQAAADQIVRFVSAFGDLTGALDRCRVTTTEGWAPFAIGFHAAAMAWDPPDRHGVRRRGNDARAPVAARSIGLLMSLLSESEFDAAGSVVKCRTLRAFATHQAMAMLMDATPVRRCQRCQQWFSVRLHGARFCTTSCQNQAGTESRAERAAANGHHLGDLAL